MPEVDGTCEYVLDPDDPKTWGGEEGDECHVRDEVLNEDGVWTCPHDAEDEKDLCIFHQPVDEKSDEVVVDAFLDTVDEATSADDPEARQRRLEFIGAKFGDFELGEDSPDVLTDEAVIVMSYVQIDGRFEWLVDVSDITFRGVTFVDDVVFESTEFRGAALFSYAEFDGEVADFSWGEFGGYADFSAVKFRGGADFNSARFGGTAYFAAAEFGGEANFRSEFSEEALFSSAKFSEEADFFRGEFGGEANFSSAEFGGKADFKSVEFGGETNFYKGEFREEASFYEDEFREEANFSSAVFGEKAGFNSVEFREKAGFNSVEFGEHADFSTAEFGGKADFMWVEFEGSVYFHDTEFGEADFSSVEFCGTASFIRGKFNKAPNFAGIDMGGANFEEAHLENADFDGADLSGANLERATLSNADLFEADLSGARLYGARIGGVTINTETVFDRHGKHRCVYDPNSEYEYEPDEDEKVEPVRKAMGAYHVLEQLTRANTLPSEQSKFFARRQDMRRAQLRQQEDFPRFNYWFAELQNVVFRHGESFSRVVGCSVGTIVFFALVFPLGGWVQSESTGTITYGSIAESPLLLWQTFYHSTLLFLTGGGPLDPTGTVGEVLTTIEALVAPILLALLVFVLGRRAAR